ncbi:MAG: DUF5011 domain-containing protein [Bacteroidales bacterium]|nr:DUF5011 domain-containing protein [Bacteroidales bacterium]
MKKITVILISLLLISGSIFITSCEKDDSSAPVVTLTGDPIITHILNQPYVDLGATAIDDGEPIEVIIEVNGVEVNMVGTYKVIWTAVDAAGNKGSAEREVTVYNEANFLIGNYNVHGESDSNGVVDVFSYSGMIIVAGNVNNQIWETNFNNYQGAAVFMQVDGSNITIENQTVGNPPNQRTFSGYGYVDENTGDFEIHSMEIFTGPPSYTKQCVAAYIRQ